MVLGSLGHPGTCQDHQELRQEPKDCWWQLAKQAALSTTLPSDVSLLLALNSISLSNTIAQFYVCHSSRIKLIAIAADRVLIPRWHWGLQEVVTALCLQHARSSSHKRMEPSVPVAVGINGMCRDPV